MKLSSITELRMRLGLVEDGSEPRCWEGANETERSGQRAKTTDQKATCKRSKGESEGEPEPEAESGRDGDEREVGVSMLAGGRVTESRLGNLDQVDANAGRRD